MCVFFFLTRVSTYVHYFYLFRQFSWEAYRDKVEDTLHKTVLIGFNPLPARGCHTKSCPIFLFLFLPVVHQINFCVVHTKLSHIAKINQDISICNECILKCIRQQQLHLTIQAVIELLCLGHTAYLYLCVTTALLNCCSLHMFGVHTDSVAATARPIFLH